MRKMTVCCLVRRLSLVWVQRQLVDARYTSCPGHERRDAGASEGILTQSAGEK